MVAPRFLGEDPVELDVPIIDIEHGHVGNPELNEAGMAEVIEWVVIEIHRYVFKWNIPELKAEGRYEALQGRQKRNMMVTPGQAASPGRRWDAPPTARWVTDLLHRKPSRSGQRSAESLHRTPSLL
ncbi:MAG: hypothetical protein IIA27_10895 [Gemmatimonadetes bacterium]|nr:hypothetical protein [Gemmatimonadota bacterium]